MATFLSAVEWYPIYRRYVLNPIPAMEASEEGFQPESSSPTTWIPLDEVSGGLGKAHALGTIDLWATWFVPVDVKNWGDSEILPYLQTTQLAASLHIGDLAKMLSFCWKRHTSETHVVGALRWLLSGAQKTKLFRSVPTETCQLHLGKKMA